MKQLDHYLETAIKNIQDDREVTRELLDDVMRYLSKDEERHTQVGSVAAKYVETLQRSNEQLVKLATIMFKKEAAREWVKLNSEFEFEFVFDCIPDQSISMQKQF